MKRRMLKKAAFLGVTIALILFSKNTSAQPGTRPETAVEIKILQEWKGTYSSYPNSSRLLIKTEDQWQEVWEKVHALRLPCPELPEISFEKKMAIAVFMGTRRSGGYEIMIKKITKKEKEIIVEVEEKEPPPESLRTMALAQPYHIVVIKRPLLPIRFQDLQSPR